MNNALLRAVLIGMLLVSFGCRLGNTLPHQRWSCSVQRPQRLPLVARFAFHWAAGYVADRDSSEATAGVLRVSRRIKAAQQKIEKEAFGDSDAGSAAEWLDANVPTMKSD